MIDCERRIFSNYIQRLTAVHKKILGSGKVRTESGQNLPGPFEGTPYQLIQFNGIFFLELTAAIDLRCQECTDLSGYTPSCKPAEVRFSKPMGISNFCGANLKFQKTKKKEVGTLIHCTLVR